MRGARRERRAAEEAARHATLAAIPMTMRELLAARKEPGAVGRDATARDKSRKKKRRD